MKVFTVIGLRNGRWHNVEIFWTHETATFAAVELEAARMWEQCEVIETFVD